MQPFALLKSMRIPFLFLTPICIALGSSISYKLAPHFNTDYLPLVLLCALFAHISVNLFNEYFDFKSGLDLITQKTPFSGGSGALVNAPQMVKSTLFVAVLTITVTGIVGLYLVYSLGLAILPLGLLGVALVLFYTQWINKHPWICLVSPGLAFGIIMVAGSQFATSDSFHSSVWLIALVPFFLTNNLLLINQYPDLSPDSQSGRNHFPIAFGIPMSNFVYALFFSLTVIVITYLVINKTIPALALIALTLFPLAFKVLSGAIKYGEQLSQHPKYLAWNVVLCLSCPTLLTLGILLG